MEKLYDYRTDPGLVLKAQEHLDCITDRQLIQLSEYLYQIEQEEREKDMDYIKNMILPVLQKFAEREEGTLKIIDSDINDIFSVVIDLPYSFVLDSGNMDVRLAMMMANYISFKASENQVEIDLSYNC
ncbi:hypothetical protein [Lacrimispora sp. 210928-DFI.3.58]|uniref:hypothetical protein n=1 Tax=Lacrimispora sp. 210928-DFI.3.58 TaxID=2883214 RepID=UPI001D06B09C|nr:hypothetical protein [Lacrimispora sp. 210928-DFI.3.58]MCB7319895.1 hypothetical protein [Lacrimispora sp. 210928-DFI.3.58]